MESLWHWRQSRQYVAWQRWRTVYVARQQEHEREAAGLERRRQRLLRSGLRALLLVRGRVQYHQLLPSLLSCRRIPGTGLGER